MKQLAQIADALERVGRLLSAFEQRERAREQRAQLIECFALGPQDEMPMRIAPGQQATLRFHDPRHRAFRVVGFHAPEGIRDIVHVDAMMVGAIILTPTPVLLRAVVQHTSIEDTVGTGVWLTLRLANRGPSPVDVDCYFICERLREAR